MDEKSSYYHIGDYEAFQKRVQNSESETAQEKPNYFNIADIAAFQASLQKEDEKMENEDELPQTDEVKTILNQLSQLKTKRTDLQNELAEVEIKINELQDQLVKEKSRTSSVSDNIKIFEGLKDDQILRRNAPQRSHTQIIHRSSTTQPSSYVDLWICNSGGDGVVEVPESFGVKPAKKSDEEANLNDSDYYCEPPEEVTQTPTKTPLNDSADSDSLAKYRDLMIPIKKDQVQESEPIYANVMIDDFMKNVDEANISEDSEHELLEEDSQKRNFTHQASAKLVDHSTVRNIEEAKMYTQRNHIVQSFYDSEVVYHKYLKKLHQQYSHYMQLAQSKEKGTYIPMNISECRQIYTNIPDIEQEQEQLVQTVKRRLTDWKPDSTFHEIVYKITSNLKMYEEYVNHYTKAIQIVGDILARASKIKKKGGSTGDSASEFKKRMESIDVGDGKVMSLQNLLFQPILQLTKRSAIVQEILVYTPARHSDHTKLRQYIDSFHNVLSTVNKNHKAKGHRKVENRPIIKAGYITEKVDNVPKLRKIVLANGIMICLKANSNDRRWYLPLAKVTIEEDNRTEEIDINTRNQINKLDDKIMNLTHKQAQESKRAKDKTTQEIKKLTLERLKLSQTVPLIIRDISSREMHYFLLASEYERAIWTEAINKAQMSSLGSRITEYDIKEGF